MARLDPRWFLGLGVAGAVAGLAGAVALGAAGWRAWLAGAILTISVPIGAAGLALMARLIPGPWRDELEPALRDLARLLPVGAFLMAPVLLAAPTLYPWADEPQGTAFRTAWFATPFFAGRALVWLAGFAGIAVAAVFARGRTAAAIGLLVFVPLTSVAAVDWVMSLDPDFNSSGFGLYVTAMQTLTALALATALTARGGNPERLGILGGVLLTAILLWAYLAFMPYVIVWWNNLPAGVAWYQRRGGPGWKTAIFAASFLRLAPAALLLSPRTRNDPRRLFACAAAVIFGTAVEVAWLVLPAQGPPAGGAAIALFALVTASGTLASFGAYQAGRHP